MEQPPALLDVAVAIADLTPVDWEALEAGSAGAVERDLLTRLRLLDRVVRACAEIVPPGSASVPGRGRSDEPPPGTWGPFTLHERIGRGTFGDVYRAHDRRLDRIVALKLLRPGREGADPVESEVVREGQLLARVRHPNVVTVHGAERIDGRVGVWMEFVDGRTLEEELRASGPLAAHAVVEVGLALCSALAAVHDAGLLHRDIKAHNVMRATDGRLLLTDFGAGRPLTEALSEDGRGELAGTPLYLAPEVLRGAPASVASELYSLGVLLYHLSTGSFPVRGRTLRELREAHGQGARVSMRAYRDRVPRALAAVVDRATDPDPARRFDSFEALGRALHRTRGARARMRKAALLGSAALALAVGALNLAWHLEPPLRIVERTVVLEDAVDVNVKFARGERLYFTRGLSLHSIVPGRGDSERTEFDGASPFQVHDLSADGRNYLALKPLESDTSELWILPSSGLPRRVGTVTCQAAAWSPEGRRIACADGDRLAIVTPDGRASRRLPTPSARVGQPTWSPDGNRIRFTADTSVRDRLSRAIWEVRTDGRGLRQLLPGWSDFPSEQVGAWTLGGRHSIFRSLDDWRSDLWALREPRGLLDWTRRPPVRLTPGPESFGSPFAVSPDGTTIYTVVATLIGELVRYDRHARRFVPHLGGASAFSVTYSPDRRSVAYISYPELKLWRADADGRNARQLVSVPVEMKGAAWSPDNRWLAFAGRLDGEHMKIHLVPADGSGSPRPIIAVNREQGNPSWSPDGRQLCYGDVPQRFGVPDGGEVLHVYDLDSRTESALPGSDGLWTCRWSPDGRYIAGLRIDLGPRRMMIHIFDVRQRTWRALPEAHHVNEPTWSSDSQFIHYDMEGEEFSLRRVRVSDGAVEELTSLVQNSWARHWSGLTPGDEPLLLRAAGSARLYGLKVRAD